MVVRDPTWRVFSSVPVGTTLLNGQASLTTIAALMISSLPFYLFNCYIDTQLLGYLTAAFIFNLVLIQFYITLSPSCAALGGAAQVGERVILILSNMLNSSVWSRNYI